VRAFQLAAVVDDKVSGGISSKSHL
jgi:hypothetical protein